MRKILIVALGIVLSFLGTALGGYLLYRFSDFGTRYAAPLGLFVFNPFIALVVGSCAGVLAKGRARLLSVLSLTPWAFGFLLSKRQGMGGFFVLVVLLVLYLFLGAAAAAMMEKRRSPAVGILPNC